MSAVCVMRAIVWCSPHSGHWETSSKRLRQLTQRRRPGSWVGRSQGSPQFGHGARSRMLLPPGTSDIPLIITGQSADEKPRRPITVGTELQGAGLVWRGEARGERPEVVELQRRDLAGGGGLE